MARRWPTCPISGVLSVWFHHITSFQLSGLGPQVYGKWASTESPGATVSACWVKTGLRLREGRTLRSVLAGRWTNGVEPQRVTWSEMRLFATVPAVATVKFDWSSFRGRSIGTHHPAVITKFDRKPAPFPGPPPSSLPRCAR